MGFKKKKVSEATTTTWYKQRNSLSVSIQFTYIAGTYMIYCLFIWGFHQQEDRWIEQ